MNLSDFGGIGKAVAECTAQDFAVRPPTLTENIDRQIGDNEKRLAELREIKELLVEEPGV